MASTGKCMYKHEIWAGLMSGVHVLQSSVSEEEMAGESELLERKSQQ